MAAEALVVIEVNDAGVLVVPTWGTYRVGGSKAFTANVNKIYVEDDGTGNPKEKSISFSPIPVGSIVVITPD